VKALVYHGPEDLRVEPRPEREPGPGEALLRVRACGICGTDLRIAAGAHRAYPEGTVRVPGHEIAGAVAAVGDGVGLPVGAAAFVAPNIGCGKCPACLAGRVNLCRTPRALGITDDGGFAEYLLLDRDVVAQGNVLVVDAATDMAALAIVEPLACALRGSRACAVGEGDLVVIVGAGPVGLMHLQVARLASPSAVIVSEPSEARRRQAVRFGADAAVEPAQLVDAVAERSDGLGADVIVTAAPAPAAQRQALELAAPGGRINFFGGLPRDRSQVELDTNLIHYGELVVTGTTANTTEDCREALDLVLSGQVDTAALVSERLPLDEADAAFTAARSGDVLKVVIEP
jgi:threonine dehydrogenase-like Zn-dependent dehydrogenase